MLKGNPGKRSLNRTEPNPERAPDVPDPPEFLTGYAAEEWRRIAAEMYYCGLLTVVDVNVFAAYCNAFKMWRTALEAWAKMTKEDPASHGLLVKTRKGAVVENPLSIVARHAANDMLKFACEFGMTPAARTRIRTGVIEFGPKPPSKFAGLLTD
jgi:P27 family predicted phage terminase small subunit